MPSDYGRCSDQSSARAALSGDDIAGLITLCLKYSSSDCSRRSKNTCAFRGIREKSYCFAGPNLVANCHGVSKHRR
jgi:hypothetical protein